MAEASNRDGFGCAIVTLALAIVLFASTAQAQLTLPYAGTQANSTYPLFSVTNSQNAGLSSATAIEAIADYVYGKALTARSLNGTAIEARSDRGIVHYGICGYGGFFDASNTCSAAYFVTGSNVPNATAVYASTYQGTALRTSTVTGTTINAETQSGTALRVRATSGTATDIRSDTGVAMTVYGNSVFNPTLKANSPSGTAIEAQSSSSTQATIYGQASSTASAIVGVVAAGNGGDGVVGQSSGRNGVTGRSYINNASGVYAENVAFGGGGYGVSARASGGGIAVYGQLLSPNGGWAGYFAGNVHVSGTLSSSNGKQFLIDHPLDPANKTLAHAAVESPELKNIYDGIVVLGSDGKATVSLPNWFEALNRDFRYQLTPLGSPASLFVSDEIRNGRFSIAGGMPGLRVSWQVTGVRHDPAAEADGMVVEQEKSASSRGKYLRADLYGAGARAIVDSPPVPAPIAPRASSREERLDAPSFAPDLR